MKTYMCLTPFLIAMWGCGGDPAIGDNTDEVAAASVGPLGCNRATGSYMDSECSDPTCDAWNIYDIKLLNRNHWCCHSEIAYASKCDPGTLFNSDGVISCRRGRAVVSGLPFGICTPAFN